MIGDKDRQAMKTRLARIEGQLRGIQRMIDDPEADCEKVAQQMSASRKALDKAAHTMIACMVKQYMANGETEDDMDIETLIAKYA